MEHIDISNPSKKFQHHLNEEANFRIFFSGKFGSGKTYFLKCFFTENEYK